MQHASTILALGALAALLGCGSPARQQAAAGPALAAQDDAHSMTGSRIPQRKSTDRMLKTVGAREVRDALDSAPRPHDSNRAY